MIVVASEDTDGSRTALYCDLSRVDGDAVEELCTAERSMRTKWETLY